MTRLSVERVPPPIYTSDQQDFSLSPISESTNDSPSASGCESLVSATSRPSTPSPRPRSCLPESAQTTPRVQSPSTTDIQLYPSAQTLALTSQGYILTYPPHNAQIQTPTQPPAPPSTNGHDTATLVPGKRPVSSLPIKLNATNYACIYRKNPSHRRMFSRSDSSIRGTFTVNPFLKIPADILPPLRRNETEVDRKNLRLEVENGGIDVDLYIVGEPPLNTYAPIPRTTIHLGLFGAKENSGTFPIAARIHTPNPNRPSFYLTAKALDGFVLFHLPRSYHGIIAINCSAGDLNSHIALSIGMYENSTILSETGQTRSYFVGEMGDWLRDGDKVELTMYNGKVFLQYEDEGKKDWSKKKGWFS
ncbi:hypothetical protein DFS33DRAFT_845584 [Desarmillaria ectypa]|nr:hypothetical protein DFS33DRAFT_845584 [Desarmillaria ectypa]